MTCSKSPVKLLVMLYRVQCGDPPTSLSPPRGLVQWQAWGRRTRPHLTLVLQPGPLERVSLTSWSLASGRGVPRTVLDIPGLLDFCPRTSAVCSPQWDPTQIPMSKASAGFLEDGAGLAEALLSHLFFLATDPGGNSWCNFTADVLRASASRVVPWPAPHGTQTSGGPANPSFPLGPGLVWVHIHLLIPPSFHPSIHTYILHPGIHSFTHSFYLMWARFRGPREESTPGVPRLVGEAGIDTMIAH